MERTFEKNIKLNYKYTFFRFFNLTNGIWMIYLFQIKGLSLLQIGMLESIFHITGIIMETPTGVIADLYGRKKSRMLGVIAFMIYVLIIVLSKEYYMMVIGFIICGLSYNLESGSGTAHIYDSLKEIKKESLFMKINSFLEATYQFGSSIALVIGGFIAQYLGFDYTYYIMVVISIISIYILFLMKENDMSHTKHISLKEGIKKQYIDTFKLGIKNKKLLFLMISSAFFASMVTISFFYLQNYWDSLSIPTSLITIFLALHGISAGIGGIFAYKIEKFLKERGILIFIPLLTIIGLWALTIEAISFYAFIVVGALDSIFFVILTDYMNRLIESKVRATLLSLSSMLFSIVMIIIFPVFGYIGDNYNLHISFIFLAIVASISFIVYLFIVNINYKKKVK